MFSEPVTVITEFLDRLCELDRFTHCLRGRVSADDRRLVEYAEFQLVVLRLSADFDIRQITTSVKHNCSGTKPMSQASVV